MTDLVWRVLAQEIAQDLSLLRDEIRGQLSREQFSVSEEITAAYVQAATNLLLVRKIDQYINPDDYHGARADDSPEKGVT
jgi:hypothetical protein